MRSLRLLVVAVLLTALAIAVPRAASSAAPPSPGAPLAARHTVTLVTGDRVLFTGTGAQLRVVGVVPARERRAVVFATITQGGDRFVFPSDAWRGLARKTLDRRLFDVTLLARDGFDDAHRTSVAIIVGGARAGLTPSVSTPAGTRVTPLTSIGAEALSVAKSRAGSLWRGLVTSGRTIWLDGRVRASLDQSVPLIGAPVAWKAGYTGKGVRVAVLDTGIDTQHPDLKGKVVLAKDFTDSGSTDDHFGHGTHVTSILTGSGAASGGRYRGVAPGVRVLNGKVLDDAGFGSDSGIIAGMQWAVANGAKIVSMSLGGYPSDGTDPLSQAVNQLSSTSGTLFVVAAGNFGGAGTVSTPASADSALAVASTTKQDRLSSFSSQGPRAGNFGLKPDIAAPGSDIVAARAPGTFLDEAVDTYYAKLSGTSMATPHVAGAAAILAQEHPSWTGGQLKAALMDSAKPLSGLGVFADGAGRVDVAAAVRATVRSTVPTASFGLLGGTSTRTVRYANDGAAPVTLHLTLTTKDQRGTVAPNGLFTLGASAVTVPAHGHASVSVTATPSAAGAGGYAGRLYATAGAIHLATPVGGEVVAPTHRVTVHVIGRDGRPVTDPYSVGVALQNERTGEIVFLPDSETGSFSAAAPSGTYRAVGVVLGNPAPVFVDEATLFARAPITVDRDRTITIDVRGAVERHVSLDQRGAEEDTFDSPVALVSDVHGTVATLSEAGFVTNLPHSYTSLPVSRRGLRLAYIGVWERPLQVATTVGPDPYRVVDILDNTTGQWRGDVTGPLVDIGQTTDPAKLPDVRGKVVLESGSYDDDGTPPGKVTDEDLTRLAKALKKRGALVVLANDYFADTSDVPLLQIYNGNDVERLRSRLAAGPVTMHVIGQPNTPFLFTLFRAATGPFPAGVDWSFRKADLARIDATYRVPDSGAQFSYNQLTVSDPASGLVGGLEYLSIQPTRRAEFVTPGVAWQTLAGVGSSGDPDVGNPAIEVSLPTVYARGSHTTQVWGTAPFGPTLPVVPASRDDGRPLPWAYRQGDKVYTNLPLFNSPDPEHLVLDASLAFGAAPSDTGSTELYRDGTVIDTSDSPGVAGYTLDAAGHRYRLVVDATRNAPGWNLTPHVHATWTFTSARTPSSLRTALPLLSARFSLPLDGRDRITGPQASVVVDRQQGSGTARVTALDVYVSYGGHFQRAAVSGGSGNRFSVTLPVVPAGAKYASLLVHAVDADGNDLLETLDRAYAVR